MTKDEALEHIYKQQDIFSKYNLNRDITDVVIPLLNDVAKVVSKINDSDAVMDNYELGFMEGKAKGVEETIDKVCDLMIDMLNDGTIEAKDIGKVNMMIRGLCGD